MRFPQLLIFSILIFLTGSIFAYTPGQAQDGGSCEALVERALGQVNQNCDGLSRNSACYGFNRVGATFNQTLPDDAFDEPADRVGLLDVVDLQTAPFDEAADTWGIAVMKAQANVPNTLPGQGVIFLLVGDALLENDVSPEQALLPSDTIVEVQVTTRANLRSRPTLNASVIDIAEPGVNLAADALDESGAWLRVLLDGLPGWVSRDLVVGADVSALPAISPLARTPMQAFTLRTRPGSVDCDALLPSLLAVQGPENIRIDLTANGVSISLGSTLVLTTPDDNTLQVAVIDGQAQVNDLIVPEGWTVTADTASGDTTLTSQSIPRERCRPLTAEELAQYKTLETISDAVVYYPIELPQDYADARCRRPGESIAPQPVSGGSAPGVSTNTAVDCSAFRPTSPLGGAAWGDNTFYWDAAPGATSYRVSVFDAGSRPIATYDTAGAETSALLYVPGGNRLISWTVQALYNGVVACTSFPVAMAQAAQTATPFRQTVDECPGPGSYCLPFSFSCGNCTAFAPCGPSSLTFICT